MMKKKFKVHYKTSHAIHNGKILRIGGLLLIIDMLIVCSINFIPVYFVILLTCLPAILLTLKDDLYGSVSVLSRLLATLFSICLSVTLTTPIIGLDMPLPMNLNSNVIFLFFVTIFSYLVLINSMNIIDGMNGLAIINSISITSALIFHPFASFLDLNSVNLLYIFMIILILLLPLNFPFQKIFIGDSGAYFIGFFLSFFIIRFMNTNLDLPSYGAILLLIYPAFETLFSFIRRFLNHKKIYLSDNKHLHSIIFNCIKNNFSINASNNLTTIVLLPFVFYGPICFYFFSNNLFYIFTSILIFIIIYTMTYLIIAKSSINK